MYLKYKSILPFISVFILAACGGGGGGGGDSDGHRLAGSRAEVGLSLIHI